MAAAAALRRGVLLVWLSHVPQHRFAGFRTLVRSCLGPNGRVLLIDKRDDQTPEPNAKDPYVMEYGPDLHRRRLQDGREYRLVKVIYEPDDLQALVTAEGWDAAIKATRLFIFGSAWSR